MIEFMSDIEVFDYCLEDVVAPMPIYVTSSKEDSDSFTLEINADQMLEHGKSCLHDEKVTNDIQNKIIGL